MQFLFVMCSSRLSTTPVGLNCHIKVLMVYIWYFAPKSFKKRFRKASKNGRFVWVVLHQSNPGSNVDIKNWSSFKSTINTMDGMRCHHKYHGWNDSKNPLSRRTLSKTGFHDSQTNCQGYYFLCCRVFLTIMLFWWNWWAYYINSIFMKDIHT